jgi:hypothetical protein
VGETGGNKDSTGEKVYFLLWRASEKMDLEEDL